MRVELRFRREPYEGIGSRLRCYVYVDGVCITRVWAERAEDRPPEERHRYNLVKVLSLRGHRWLAEALLRAIRRDPSLLAQLQTAEDGDTISFEV